jgi:shikimate kinase
LRRYNVAKGIVLTGPQACGKTVNAQMIAAYLGLIFIDDNEGWHPGDPIKADTLHITNEPTEEAFEYKDIMEEIAIEMNKTNF